jgi:hypothetical protein
MSATFEPIKALLTPEMFANLGQRVGLPPEMVKQGADIAIPLLTRGIAGVADTPEGQVAIAEAVKGADSNLLGNLSGFLGSADPSAGGDVLQRLFGDESRVVTSAIKEQTGYDIAPLLGVVGPMLLGFLNNVMQRENLDTSGLVKRLKSDARSFDRKKDDAAVLVDNVLGQVDEVRKLKGSYSAAEWSSMRNAPLAAASLVIAAAPSSAGKTREEIAAALASISESTKDAKPNSLIAALFHGNNDDISAAEISDPMGVVKSAAALVQRGAPAEAAAYKQLLVNAAYAAAQAVKEGGFLGMGAKQVNAAEQGAIDSLTSALGM